MRQVIHGEIYVEDSTKLDGLCQMFQHIRRYGYNRHQKNDVQGSIRTHCEQKFQGQLNKRWIRDAELSGNSLHTRFKDEKVIFGGRDNWKQLKTGNLSKQDWLSARDHHCYARGEANKQGNLNCKILGNQLRVNFGTRDYQYYPLHVSTKVTKKMAKQGRPSDKEKLRLLLLLAQQKKFSYNIRLRKKDANHYKVNIEYDLPDPEAKVTFANGAIGVDTNTDHIAIAETDAKGNLVNVESFDSQRIQFAKKDKRFYDIAIIVNQIIDYAKKTGKGIVFEGLGKFKKKKGSKKQNRKRSNFCFRKFLNLLEAKCIQYGIAYRPVKAAYTSIIGNLKYAKMYKITGHQAAAYVIARRGLGYKEKISLYKQNKVFVKAYLIRTLETSSKSGKYKGKRWSNWKLWSRLNKEQAVLTGPQSRLQMPFRELCGSRSSTTLEWEKSQANPSLEQVEKVTSRNISSEGRKALFQSR